MSEIENEVAVTQGEVWESEGVEMEVELDASAGGKNESERVSEGVTNEYHNDDGDDLSEGVSEDEEEAMEIPEVTSEEVDLSVPFVPKKLKKPCSAWIIYSTENRGKIKALHPHYSFKEMAGALSEGFKTLTEEERVVYTAKAKEQKERYALELAEQERLIALHGIQPGAQEASALAQKSFRLTTEAIFPMARIKRIMKLDPEVRNIKPEAAVAVAKALELFLAFMAVRVGHIASTHKRRTVKRTDVLELIHRNATTSFLKGDFPLEPKINKAKEARKIHSSTDISRRETAAIKASAGTSKITGFFQKSAPKIASKTVENVEDDSKSDDMEVNATE